MTYMDQKNLNELIFHIIQKQKFEISVNFDKKMIEFFREIRHLNHSKRKVQIILSFFADDALKVFPWANTLQNSIQTFTKLTSDLDKDIQNLIAKQLSDILKSIQSGIHLTWNSNPLPNFVKKLSKQVLFSFLSTRFYIWKTRSTS